MTRKPLVPPTTTQSSRSLPPLNVRATGWCATVATTKNSIGYLSRGFVNKSVKAVKINNVPPDVRDAISGKYSMGRYLHMFTKGQPSRAAKGFVDFVLSDRFQRDVVSQEYIEVNKVLKQ